jgi:precorrin-2 dehydrogenase / sirohydrochlorin ferrochelatase
LVPIVVVPDNTKIGLAGGGDGLVRRQDWLAEAGVTPVSVPLNATDALSGLRLLFIAGVPLEEASALAERARAAGVLVNVEDVPQFCDFHVPATVRRGDLLLSVSTGGRAPGLSKLIREWLDERFGPQWSYHLDNISHRRAQWRAEGHAPGDVAQRTREFVEKRQWL